MLCNITKKLLGLDLSLPQISYCAWQWERFRKFRIPNSNAIHVTFSKSSLTYGTGKRSFSCPSHLCHTSFKSSNKLPLNLRDYLKWGGKLCLGSPSLGGLTSIDKQREEKGFIFSIASHMDCIWWTGFLFVLNLPPYTVLFFFLRCCG